MACSYCGKDGHNWTTCPKRLAEVVRGHQATIDAHGTRLGELERKVSFLAWLYSYMALWVGLMGLITTVFLKLSEVSSFLNSVNLFLLMIVSFAAGVVLGWLIKQSAQMAFKSTNEQPETQI